MAYQVGQSFDLIIGNPPYYVMKKDEVDPSYYDYFEGRPNIFILFIIKSLKLLSKGGILSFVLPKNFLNCLYYDKTRKFIMDNYQILHIVDCNDKYIETQQKTILLIIRNVKPINNAINNNNSSFVMDLSKYTIFTTNENKQMIHQLYSNSRSLGDLGFNVRVGNIVWNQCKSELTPDDTKTRLIYSSDIKDGQLVSKPYKNADKQQYINRPGITRPMIVVNRGYGIGTYKFSFCLLNTDTEYLIENHLICIEYENESISSEELLDKYNQIIESFKDERTYQFIDNYFGNSAINTNELKYILPIY
jgi:adenine-specific DNA-methyltransferase